MKNVLKHLRHGNGELLFDPGCWNCSFSRLKEDPDFAAIEGYVDDSGEGRWTIEEAIANAVPVPAITASIFARFVSRQAESPAMKAVAALRNQFGGHSLKKVE